MGRDRELVKELKQVQQAMTEERKTRPTILCCIRIYFNHTIHCTVVPIIGKVFKTSIPSIHPAFRQDITFR